MAVGYVELSPAEDIVFSADISFHYSVSAKSEVVLKAKPSLSYHSLKCTNNFEKPHIQVIKMICFSVRKSVVEMIDPFLKFILLDPKCIEQNAKLRMCLPTAILRCIRMLSHQNKADLSVRKAFLYLVDILHNMQVIIIVVDKVLKIENC